MERDAIVDGVRKVIKTNLDLRELPGLKEKIIQDLGADSLDQVEIVMMLEDDFDISISDDEFYKADTVEDLVNLVEEKLK